MIPFSLAIAAISATMSTHAQPAPSDIREELAIAKSFLSGLSIEIQCKSVGYVGDPHDLRLLPKEAYSQTRTEYRRFIHTWSDGSQRLERWSYGDRLPGEGPFRHGVSYFDGTDTYQILQRTGRETQPGLPVVAKSGLDENVLPSHPLTNFESLVFGGLHPKGLDEMLADPSWVIVVPPTAERVHDHDCWKIELRKEGSTATFTYWLGQDIGFMPVKSTVVADAHPLTGQPGLINGTIASNFQEVRPGLWLPGVVRITDPNEPQPETYVEFTRTHVRVLDEGESLCPELASGAIDMIDFRTGERYLLLDGERGPSTPITDAKQIERSLDQLLDHGRVLAAKAPTSKRTGAPVLFFVGMSAALALAAGWWCVRIFRK